jgi:hypothetical protein
MTCPRCERPEVQLEVGGSYSPTPGYWLIELSSYDGAGSTAITFCPFCGLKLTLADKLQHILAIEKLFQRCADLARHERLERENWQKLGAMKGWLP